MNKQVKESEIAYFNTYGEDVDFDAINDKGYYRIINELLKNLSKPYFNLKVIDLGCATGCFTIKLAKLGLNNIYLQIVLIMRKKKIIILILKLEI